MSTTKVASSTTNNNNNNNKSKLVRKGKKSPLSSPPNELAEVPKKLNQDQILDQFYKHILAWDVADLKPNPDRLKKVTVSFKDERDYIKTFEPLLFEECRAQLERSILEGEKDSESEPVQGRVRYISEAGEFLAVGLVLRETDMNMFHDNDLMMISLHHPNVVFGDDSKEETDDEDSAATAAATHVPDDDPNKVAADLKKKKKKNIPPSKFTLTEENRTLHLIGTVENFENGGIKVKFCLKNIQPNRERQMSMLLQYEVDWWITKLCNLSTLQREYSALYLTAQSNFIKTLLLADEEESGNIMTIPPALHDQFSSTYNPSQLGALTSALDGRNITLIQGPPGTGKTHVILGLISVLLHSTVVPKVPPKERGVYSSLELTMEDKINNWEISQPWFANTFENIRDDPALIDYTFEEKDEKRKRDLWKKLRDTGSVKGQTKKRRILLCAPSNGAVDEIVTRLIRDGLLNAEGRKYNPNIVRIGPGSHNDVETVSLEYMVRCRQQLMSANSAIPSSSASTAQATSGSSRSNQDSNSIRSIVLDEADIVATTLSFSGSSLLLKMVHGFDIVIIDEAAQAVETSTLIPIQHQCKKIVLVGDPKQLPATIISPLAIKHGYDQSLFQRLQEKNPPHMLNTQYRMHSRIRAFPSKHFYNDLLLDGPNIPARAMDYHNNPFFGPMVFFDLKHSFETKPGGGSVINEEECKMAFLLYQLILKTHPDEDFSGRIGIISPYRQQVLTLREYFKNYPGISIDTVDGFQGREREIIIFSCVRAPVEKGSGIGFLADQRRMNVALTRPRSSLLVIGNSTALSVNPDWNELLIHMQTDGCFIPVDENIEVTVSTFTNQELYDQLSSRGSAYAIPPPKSVEDLTKSNQKAALTNKRKKLPNNNSKKDKVEKEKGKEKEDGGAEKEDGVEKGKEKDSESQSETEKPKKKSKK